MAEVQDRPPATCCPPISASPLDEGAAESLAHTYAALADPVRLRLLSLIASAGEICSCDLLEQRQEHLPRQHEP